MGGVPPYPRYPPTPESGSLGIREGGINNLSPFATRRQFFETLLNGETQLQRRRFGIIHRNVLQQPSQNTQMCYTREGRTKNDTTHRTNRQVQYPNKRRRIQRSVGRRYTTIGGE